MAKCSGKEVNQVRKLNELYESVNCTKNSRKDGKNMKRKMTLISVLALGFVLLFTGSALAATGWVHGNYTATTDACAGCHVTHSATLPDLLISGRTQTEFCFMCHGTGAPGAPYDNQHGQIIAGAGGTFPSTAGGFERTGGAAGALVTSRHGVTGYVYDGAMNNLITGGTLTIPGSTRILTGRGLVCGSCHDPHAGGVLTVDGAGVMQPGSINPRLMRTSILGQTGLNVRFRVQNLGSPDAGNPMVAYRVTGYVSGSNAWCGACHNVFNKGAGAGRTADPLDQMFRHAVGVPATLVGMTPARSASLEAAGTPLEGTDPTNMAGNVSCLTCHRAHSTTATAAGWAATWNRSQMSGVPQTADGTGSALLRMDNRGVCWNCHDAANRNLPPL